MLGTYNFSQKVVSKLSLEGNYGKYFPYYETKNSPVLNNFAENKQPFYIKVTNRLLALAGGGGHYTPSDDNASRKDDSFDESNSFKKAGNYNHEKTAEDTHADKNISEAESRKLSLKLRS